MRDLFPFLGFTSPLPWRAAADAISSHRPHRRLKVPLPTLSLSAVTTLDRVSFPPLEAAAAVPARRLTAAVFRGSSPLLSSCPRSPPLSFARRPSFFGEKMSIWIWDPGINKRGVNWSQFVASKYLIPDKSKMSNNNPIVLNQQDKVFGRHFVGEIGFFYETGHWAIKNLKDAMQSSILLYRSMNHYIGIGFGFQKRLTDNTCLVLILLFFGFVMFNGLFLVSIDGMWLPLLYLDSL